MKLSSSLDADARPPRESSPDASLRAFITRLPKTETHLHIEGALPLSLLRQAAPDRFRDGPPAWWAPEFRYPDFATFEAGLLENAAIWYTSPERYHEAARVVFHALVEQNVRYVETSFHLPITQFIHADGRDILDAIRSAAPDGMVARVFAAMRRIDYTPALAPVIDSLHTWDNLAGVDLHGVEGWPLEAWTAPVWRRVAEAGKVTKAHAGELTGAERVREVVEQLGVRRVQHGIRAIEDPAVVDLLLERGVTCDVCVTNNVKLGVVPSYEAHPIGRLLDAGVRCTVSTDDPFCFGGTLSEEYMYLARSLRFTPQQLALVARNGFEVAAMPEPARQEILDQLDEMTHGT
jgi:adenosine deaminase